MKGPLEAAWDLWGALHPATVHFPIALLVCSALFVLLRRKWPSISADVPYYCLVVGAASAACASVMGWSFAQFQGYATLLDPSSDVFLHRWSGVTVTVLALACAALAVKGRSVPDAPINKAWQMGVLVTAVLIALFGGATRADLSAPRDGNVSLMQHVAPILEAKCVKCHGTRKEPKGEFRMVSRDGFFKGGKRTAEKGFAIVTPFSSDINETANQFLYSMRHPDPDYRMPPAKEKNPVTDEELDVLKQWVRSGAAWPEGFALTEPEPQQRRASSR
jgi:predicted membrane protein DUF2231/cytochrome c